MAETIDELLVKLGLETDAKGFKEANNHFTGLRTTALAVGAALGAAFVGAAVGLGKMSVDTAKARDEMGKWAKDAGVSIQFADKLRHAMEKFGGTEADSRGLIDTVNNLREAAKWGELAERSFTSAGFNPQRIQQEGMDQEQTLDFIARGLSSIKDRDERNRIAESLGIGNPFARNMLADRDGMQAAFRRAEELGLVTDELVANSAAYNDAVTDAERVMRSLADMIAVELLPNMTSWVEAMTGWVAGNKGGVVEAVSIISGEGSALEKARKLVTNKEVQKTAGNATSAYFDWIDTATGWHPANMMMHKLFGEGASAPDGKSGPRPGAADSDAFDALFNALINQESGGKHYGDGSLLRSGKGARGISQVMPATGQDPGYGVSPLANDSKEEYLRFGRDYLTAMLGEFDGDTQKALAAYNAGPGAVKKAVSSHGANWLSAMPGETQAYVPSIMSQAGKGGSTNYYSIDARGATDPGAVENAARKVFKAELSNAVQISRDDFPNNVE